jgi:hypothetical protein
MKIGEKYFERDFILTYLGEAISKGQYKTSRKCGYCNEILKNNTFYQIGNSSFNHSPEKMCKKCLQNRCKNILKILKEDKNE